MFLWHHKWFKTLVVSLILLTLVFVLPDSLQKPVRVMAGIAAQPFEQIFSFVGFKLHDTFSVFTSIGSFKNENARLLAENLRLQSENAQLESLRRENESLRRELGAPVRDGVERIAADVIGWNVEDAGRWIVVNRGSVDGLAPGMPAVSGGGVLIGRVDEVFPTSAKIMLLTHPESVVNVVDESTEARGVLRGEYGLGMVFDMVPQTDRLQSGDRVVTSGLGGELPRALVIGMIGEVRHTPDGLFQQATVTPSVTAEKARFVEIMKKF